MKDKKSAQRFTVYFVRQKTKQNKNNSIVFLRIVVLGRMAPGKRSHVAGLFSVQLYRKVCTVMVCVLFVARL